MNGRSKMVAVGVGKAALSALRFALFVVLSLLGRLLMPLAELAIGVGVLGFLMAWLVVPGHMPMHHGMMVFCACLGGAAVALQLGYAWLLALLAPAGTVVFTEV